MAQFASATFTGTAFSTLQSVDANWSKQTGWTGDLIIGAGGSYVIRNDNVTAGVYRHSGAPANADYTVSADIAVLNANAASPQLGVCGRMAAAAQTMYIAVWGESAGNIRLFKWVAGTQTQLGSSYTYTLTTTPASLRLRMDGTSISVELDGATIIGPVTDSAITTAGAAGIYLFHNRETGVSDATSLDNFSADDIVVSDTTPPTITGPGGATGSTSSVSVAENSTAVHTFTANESVTWSLNGGADVARFTINSSTGALAFLSAPDYETPTDADTNNVYVVVVRATDGAANTTDQTVSVTVTDVSEGGGGSAIAVKAYYYRMNQ